MALNLNISSASNGALETLLDLLEEISKYLNESIDSLITGEVSRKNNLSTFK